MGKYEAKDAGLHDPVTRKKLYTAVMENFFGQLKTEAFYGERFESVDELAAVLEAHIGWYNLKRRQERLKGMAPMEYRHYALAA